MIELENGRLTSGVSYFFEGVALRYNGPPMNRLLALCLLASLPGCASAYDLSPATLSARAKMDVTKAEAAIAKAVAPEPDGRGGIHFSRGHYGNVNLSVYSQRTEVMHQHIVFWTIASRSPGSAVVAGPAVGVVPYIVSLPVDCEPIPGREGGGSEICPQSLNLRKLDRITVSEYPGRPLDVEGPLVILKGIDRNGDEEHVEVSMRKDKLDEFLAAATWLSPEARVTDGAGF